MLDNNEKKPVGYSWNPEEKIEISGKEFNTIVKLSQLFTHLGVFTEGIMKRLIESGQAKPIYEEQNSKEVKEKN